MTDAAGTRARGATRAAILASALRLFGEQGYAATSIAQIEEASGLRPGSGGLYRHFSSKRELLSEGIRSVLDAHGDLASTMAVAPADDLETWRLQVRAIAHAGFARLDHDRDLSRIMIRDLRDVPDLATEVRQREVDGTTAALAEWFRRSRTDEGTDPDAVAAVVVSAVSHHWTLADATGAPVLGLDRDRFIDALAEMVERTLRPRESATAGASVG